MVPFCTSASRSCRWTKPVPLGSFRVKLTEANRPPPTPAWRDPQVDGRVGRDAAVELDLGHDRAGPIGVLPVADVEAVEDQARVEEVVGRVLLEPRGVETEAELGLGAELACQVRPERPDDREELVEGEAQVQLRRLVGDQRHVLAQQQLEGAGRVLRIGMSKPVIGLPV